MTHIVQDRKSETVVLHLPESWAGNEDFFELCSKNETVRLERSAEGDLIVMLPAGGESSHRNLSVAAQLYVWAVRDGSGVAFDSSAGFVLPNQAIRSPDAAWVSRSRLSELTSEQKRRFLPLCPEFVLELLSPSDVLPGTQAKMTEYIENGAMLGWLIDPDRHRVSIYRPGHPVETLDMPAFLSGNPEMPGLVLDLATVWAPGF